MSGRIPAELPHLPAATGHVIRDLLAERGETAGAVAQRAGVNAASMYRLKDGTGDLSLVWLCQLADAFELRTSELLNTIIHTARRLAAGEVITEAAAPTTPASVVRLAVGARTCRICGRVMPQNRGRPKVTCLPGGRCDQAAA
jgi:hypothetical protein